MIIVLPMDGKRKRGGKCAMKRLSPLIIIWSECGGGVRWVNRTCGTCYLIGIVVFLVSFLFLLGRYGF